jgi:hypothetical protein
MYFQNYIKSSSLTRFTVTYIIWNQNNTKRKRIIYSTATLCINKGSKKQQPCPSYHTRMITNSSDLVMLSTQQRRLMHSIHNTKRNQNQYSDSNYIEYDDDMYEYSHFYVRLVQNKTNKIQQTNNKNPNRDKIYHTIPSIINQQLPYLSYRITKKLNTNINTHKENIAWNDDNDNDDDDASIVETIIIHPIWLWCNDPTFIHSTSGQHIRHNASIEYYSKQIQIDSIQVIPLRKTSTKNIRQTTIPAPLPPPSGSLHPIGGIYETNKNDTITTTIIGKNKESDQKPVQQYLVHVKWKSLIDQTMTIDSYYDIAWLIRCCTYDSSNLKNTTKENNTSTMNVLLSNQSVNEQTKQPLWNIQNIDINSDDNIKKNFSVQIYDYHDVSDTSLLLPDVINDTQQNNIYTTTVSPTGAYTILDTVFRDGAMLIQNVPYLYDTNDCKNNNDNESMYNDTNTSVAIFGKILSGGRLSHGQLYGDVFHVRDKTPTSSTTHTATSNTTNTNIFNDQSLQNMNVSSNNDNNIAYTTVALQPHQDLAYYESIPGLQLLHCIENDVQTIQGGTSILIDGIKAAYEFQRLVPTLFDILVHCNATFIKQRQDADMIYRRPHFQVDHSDNHNKITSIRWSPPFEGPLFLPTDLIEDYYIAYSAFERMIDNSLPRLYTTPIKGSRIKSINHRLLPHLSLELESDLCNYAHTYTWEYRMKCGDMIIFNNQRMLHGRRAYTYVSPKVTSQTNETTKCGRHLMGCYTNIDDTLNQYRLLRRQFYRKKYELPSIPFVGNSSSVVP